ncbi:glycosyltransferase [Haloarcula sebkhae]|uniref:Glycosyltransferase n=2 Tax=Haloarcula sebkhae TaxID=932660 RepID=A0ACC6VIZ3_9EURY|nr:glycosyltransferase [Haloarcula sebkhae]GGK74977.1 glycosyl transferase family 1 [Haloarcula sebkhae]
MISVSYLIGNLDKEHGGAQQLLYDICSNLPQDDFDLTVYHMFGPGTFASDFRKQGVSVTHLEATSNYDLSAYWRLIKHLLEDNPDIVHTNSPISGVWGRTAGKIASIPHLVSVEHNVHTEYEKLARLSNGITLPLSDVIVGVSETVSASYLPWERRLLPDSTDQTTIQNGVNSEQIKKSFDTSKRVLNQSTPFSPDDPIIGTVGRLTDQKGYKYLIESYPLIKSRHPDAKLLIIGDGPKRAQLESVARETQFIDDIYFTGYVPDVYPFLPNFDVAVFPSLWEGFGLTPIESMVAKRPVVATDIEIFNEVIDDAGILVEPKNPSALADAVSSLLDDHDRRAGLGEKGHDRAVNQFSIERTVAEYAELYRCLINE